MIKGRVIEGQKLGRELGFPTLNLDVGCDYEYGVYACQILIAGESFDGVLHWGPKGEDIPNGKPVLEVHVFDFESNVYDMQVEVRFGVKIRDIKRFFSLEELRLQIDQDVVAAKAVLG